MALLNNYRVSWNYRLCSSEKKNGNTKCIQGNVVHTDEVSTVKRTYTTTTK